MKFRAAILAVAILLGTAASFGQSCAMCYGSAKSTGKEGQRAINTGVLVLLAPPFGFMTLGVWMAFRYGKKRDIEQGLEPSVDASQYQTFGLAKPLS